LPEKGNRLRFETLRKIYICKPTLLFNNLRAAGFQYQGHWAIRAVALTTIKGFVADPAGDVF
jgi:hypothetical protein